MTCTCRSHSGGCRPRSPRAGRGGSSRRRHRRSPRPLGVEVQVALLRTEVVLHPEALAGGVDPLVGVRAEAVHLAPRLRQAAVAHEVGDLVGRLGREGPEVPLHVGVAQARARQALLRVDEVGELDRVADEEHRGVVADDVVVALGRVELQREAAHVAPGVGRALLAGDRREAQQRLGSWRPAGRPRPGVRRDILGHLEAPNAPPPFACTMRSGMRSRLNWASFSTR